MNQGEMILTPEEAALLISNLWDSPARWRKDEDRAQWLSLRERIEACAARIPAPLKGDRLWNGLTMDLHTNDSHHNQSATVVRARSAAEAVRLLKQAGERMGSGSRFRTHWSEAASNEMRCAATERGVWVRTSEGWIKK